MKLFREKKIYLNNKMDEIKLEIPKTDLEKRTFIHNYSKDFEIKINMDLHKNTKEKIDEKEKLEENITQKNKVNNISIEDLDKHSQR